MPGTPDDSGNDRHLGFLFVVFVLRGKEESVRLELLARVRP
jgi:hypothetical protein